MVLSVSPGISASPFLTMAMARTEVAVHDATAHRLTLALTRPAGSVASRIFLEEQTNTLVGQHTLLHGESLLVVASSDAENVALELISESVALNLSAHPLLVERTNLELIVDLDELLAAGGRVGQIDLHPSHDSTISCRSESSN